MSIRRAAMSQMNTKRLITLAGLLPVVLAAAAVLFALPAHAAAPGLTGTSFTLTAQPAYISQPDGAMVYSWGYGCTTPGTGHAFAPSVSIMPGSTCPSMQVPGPTLIVTEGQVITVTLTNGLPTSAGNTSILFPGFQLQPFTDGTPGLLTQEAAPSGTVTYKFTAGTPGTRAYYSGTQGDLQVEMGLYGAIIVLPASSPTGCITVGSLPAHYVAPGNSPELDFR